MINDKPLYRVIFENGSIFNGGFSITNSLWKEIPDKPIKRLEYSISTGEAILLEGFESYFCFFEATATFKAPIGKCPKCGSLAKMSYLMSKDNKGNIISKKLVFRCTKYPKCDWIGKSNELNENVSGNKARFIYIMGLKEGMITSYRISLIGVDGENRYQRGDITKRIALLGQEYRGKSTNYEFWRPKIQNKGIK